MKPLSKTPVNRTVDVCATAADVPHKIWALATMPKMMRRLLPLWFAAAAVWTSPPAIAKIAAPVSSLRDLVATPCDVMAPRLPIEHRASAAQVRACSDTDPW